MMTILGPSGRRQLARGVILSLSTLAGASAANGQVADATIFGRVTDESGAVLPGVTVTVTSPALQVKQLVEVTSVTGEYRITPLPLGTYTVEFVLTGFQTHRNEGLRLTAGFQARVDMVLGVASVAETVTVSGQSPVVDVKTTSAGTQVTREILDTVPTARNSLNSLLTLAAGARPAVDSGDVRGVPPVMRAFGRNRDFWVTIDGLPVTDGSGAGETAANYGTFEEATVTTLASSAEAPGAGMQVSVITKSGSNQLHGGGLGALTTDWMQGDNLNDTLRAQGLQQSVRYSERWDMGGDLGGRIVQDKLWFYGAARIRQEAIGIAGAFNADGSQSQFTTDQRFVQGKLTHQLTPDQQLVGQGMWRRQWRFNGPESFLHDIDTMRTRPAYTRQGQGQWQMVKGNRVLLVHGGTQIVEFPVAPQLTQNSQWTDEVTGRLGGIDNNQHETSDRFRWTGQATLNWYKSNWAGNHDFKLGLLYTVAAQDNGAVDRGFPIGNYSLIYRSNVPFAVDAINAPTDPESRLANLGTYVQDSWAFNRRLTLNLGIRYSNDRAYLPSQCRDAAPREFAQLFPAECFPRKALTPWNTVAPRLHAAYDVTGNGKTVLKGGWGRFYTMHYQEDLNPFNPNARKRARFLWRDLNANRRFDAGESNLDLAGPDFVSIAGGEAGLVNNPDLRSPGSDEFALSIERELAGNFGMRATGVYVSEFNSLRSLNTLRPYEVFNIPVRSPDPGPDGVVGNADDPGTILTYYDYPAALRGAAFQRPMFINHEGSNAKYTSFEVALDKRLSNRWQMLASYSATRHEIPVPRRAAFDPNAEINVADNTWEWQFRGTGSYRFPADVQVSTNFVTQSGDPWARTVSLRGGQQVPSLTVNAEPIGARQNDTVTVVSLSAEKGFNLRAGHRLMVGTNILNLLDAAFPSPGEEVQKRSGATLGRWTRVVPSRVGEITLRYTF